MTATERLQGALNRLSSPGVFGKPCEYNGVPLLGLVSSKETATEYDEGLEIEGVTLRVLVSKAQLPEKPAEQDLFTARGSEWRIKHSTEDDLWFRVYLTNPLA